MAAPKTAEKTVSQQVRYWTNEIAAARKREKDYRKEGERIRAIYSGEKKKTTPFNILYSNTETLLPALYGATPKPIVQRRFKDADPVGRAAAMAGQRTLEFLLDTNIEEYETFDQTMKDSVLDALLPGRGVARAKYEAELTQVPTGKTGAEGKPETVEQKTHETVCTELVGWNRWYHGYAKKWSKVPWIAFEHYMDRDEALKLFDEAVVNKMVFSETDDQERGEDGEGKAKEQGTEGSERKTCLVYEIWRREGKKVCFFSPHYAEGYLKEEDDPLELTGFYPLPKPVQFLAKTDDLSPGALYLLYENQAAELNKISVRINRIVEAIKVRGAYDGSLGDTLNQVLKGDDNMLVPTDNTSNIALEGGLDKYIWLMPLDMLIGVLKQLFIARQECKQIIYEVTGLSDIIRGASDAQETATAQTIKNQWGSLRIKMLQNEVRRYVREMLRMMLEIAAKKFSPETFARMTGLPFTTQAQKQQAQQLLATIQQQGQQTGTTLDKAPPQVQQDAKKAQATLQTPDWEAVIALLQDDIARSYRIDIETNSTVEVNEQEDKQNVTEALAAIGQYLQGVTPLVKEGTMPFEAAKSMLLAIVRKFRFGTEVEEEIKSMQPPQGGGDGEAQKKVAEAEKKAASAEMRAQAAETENKLNKRSADLDVREIKVQAEEARLQLAKQAQSEIGQHRDTATKLSEDGARREQEIATTATETLSGGVQAMQGIVENLMNTVAAQSAQTQQVLETLVKAITAPRKRTPKRGADGRIAEVVDEVVR